VLQLKPKKTAVVEATPTVGMSIEAFSKVCPDFSRLFSSKSALVNRAASPCCQSNINFTAVPLTPCF
jgi:hypothetical protein